MGNICCEHKRDFNYAEDKTHIEQILQEENNLIKNEIEENKNIIDDKLNFMKTFLDHSEKVLASVKKHTPKNQDLPKLKVLLTNFFEAYDKMDINGEQMAYELLAQYLK